MTQKPSWHALSADEVCRALETSRRGLVGSEAARRQQYYGENSLQQAASTPSLLMLLRQFHSPLIYILLVGMVLSSLIGEQRDAIAIGIIILINGLLGFSQEWRAERAVTALRRLLDPQARVIRDGLSEVVASSSVVPGDLVMITAGDRVPADLKLLQATNLQVDESALTGESMPVSKQALSDALEAPLVERASMCWAGTVVTNGHGIGVTTAIGTGTEFGRVAGLTGEIQREVTTLQRMLVVLARQLGIAAIVIGIVIVAAGMVAGRAPLEVVFMAVALAIAVVPEGLPAVVTITLALGVFAMSRKGALMRRLQAAETLGAATVVCTDKTGTLTQSAMTVVSIWLPEREINVVGAGYDPTGHFEYQGERLAPAADDDLMALLMCGLICSNASVEYVDGAWRADGPPTETALVALALKGELCARSAESVVHEFSFDSERKRMTVVIDGKPTVAYTKGAPEVVLPLCTTQRKQGVDQGLDAAARVAAIAAHEDLAGSGLRVLALAMRELPPDVGDDAQSVEQQLSLLGFVGIIDPPRPEVPAAIATAYDAGLNVVMITGDAAPTATSVARTVGMRDIHTIDGATLDNIDDESLDAELHGGAVFARTTPEHKLRIMRVLQSRDEIVAMTGDGINDAPALKKANVGIAMGIKGTEVAKEAADIVLTDDNFASIISAVAEGRRQYENIRRFVSYMLSSNAGEVVAIVLNVVLGGPLILLPVQILWMNLVTDGITAVALGVEPATQRLMRRPPRKVHAPLLQRRHLWWIAPLGMYIGAVTYFFFEWYRSAAPTQGVAYAQTMAFTAIIVLEKFNVLNFRSLQEPLHRLGWFSNRWVVAAWLATMALQVAVIYLPFFNQMLHTVPLHLQDWLIILLAALPIVIVPEIIKTLRAEAN